ncbi:MAG: nickel pincer cofactor biosynthesis protein LarB [Nitrospirales bacterium]|nr:nickel pincer cofactor biosynthesis protein LarB [Nitrospirales bacterium]
MDSGGLQSLLQQVREGKTAVAEALKILKDLPFEGLGIANVDHHRGIRNGIPEVIYGKDKAPEDVVSIAGAMYKKSGRFLITRATQEVHEALQIGEASFHRRSGVISCGEAPEKKGHVLVVSAGTSDIPVAEEAELTAAYLGSRTERLYDVGVAGVHRLLHQREKLREARVVIVVAGMEGALPSVVGGLTDRPLIAVPTSTGYGTSMGGLTALFAMLNSCVPGIAVVNIDNGFGAGCLAHRINMMGLTDSEAQPVREKLSPLSGHEGSKTSSD